MNQARVQRPTQERLLWQRPLLQIPESCDTVFFDVDGVLIDPRPSLYAAYIAVVEYIIGRLHGLTWGQREGLPLVTLDDVLILQRIGSLNNYHDLAYVLAVLTTVRLREWRRTPLGRRSTQTWATLARNAYLQGLSGIAWVQSVTPASAHLDYDLVGDIYREAYWGADLYTQHFGRAPHFLPDAAGFVHRERLLFSPHFPARLRDAGIQKMGLITGRDGPEVTSAIARLHAQCDEHWWDVIISADDCLKPDPRALRLAIEAVGARGGLYIGDTATDCDLVANYRSGKFSQEPEILSVMCVGQEDWLRYQARGADIILDHVEGVVFCLAGMRYT